MKHCPICHESYGVEVEVCVKDGATLEISKTRPDPYLGKLIKGRYQILRKLGEGGMGMVYLAEQISIARKVALKLLQGIYAGDDEFIERFRREARLAASLNHRNIVTVYDFDQADDGTLFIAMEYVDGRQLSDVIRREGRLDIGRAIRLGVQMAAGLEAAHKTGVIHRDIKPDNVMVVGARGMEEIKLMDFGIARLRDTGTTSRLTRPDMIMGTPAYMAPEQAEGAEVSDRTDIYAVGIVLYEMLCGSVPFKASTPGAVLVQQIQERPVPLRKLRREVSAPVERVVMQALEKKPQKRQQHIREVLEGLKKAEGTIVERTERTIPVNDMPRTMAATLPLRATVIEKLGPLQSRYVWTGLGTVALVLGLACVLYWLTSSASLKAVDPRNISLPIEKTEIRPAEQSTPSEAGAYPQRGEKQIGGLSESRSGNETVAPADLKARAEGRQYGTAEIPKKSSPPVKPVTKKPPEVGDALSPPAPPGDPATGSLSPGEKRPLSKVGENPKVQEHLKLAKLFRERGDYSDAIEELQKAASLDPANKQVRADLEKTRKACNAEKVILGRPGLKC